MSPMLDRDGTPSREEYDGHVRCSEMDSFRATRRISPDISKGDSLAMDASCIQAGHLIVNVFLPTASFSPFCFCMDTDSHGTQLQ